MLGWVTYALYKVFIKKKDIIKYLFIALIAGYMLALIKVYILISYIPFFTVFLILKNVSRIKNSLVKIVIGLSILTISITSFFLIADRLKKELGLFSLDRLSESVQTQQKGFMLVADEAESSFSLGVEFDGSLSSFIKMAPPAIIATLYRPFLWESKKISTLLSSLESLAMMLFTLYVMFKVRFLRFITTPFRDVTVFYCFAFALVFALFVGATTLNFGTLVRYKIPCLPFYLIALFIIEDRYNKKKTIAV
jgi:hypothetical protein